MHIYIDESGGVGRGVMTLAAVSVDPDAAAHLLSAFRKATGLQSELKGSRINLDERSHFFELFEQADARAIVGVATLATRPEMSEDRGEHDQHVYAALIDDVVRAWLPETGGCAQIVMDDGRYDALTLSEMTRDVAEILGGFGAIRTELSHHLPGLQIADVVANSFFNRALVNDRQGHFVHVVEPHLASLRIRMRILTRDALDGPAHSSS